ncbi:protein FAM166B-like isoform X2 [Mercenaria mercenaria]|uniref:protein FAM166B-like isoform X2 n=1 Tax=Mercenaria mercenaria TaxID=6596 RepID=UPI001E1DD63C|nr:protein FAM166B-like isoform X2 [Mercenaria mercenaria]
MTTIAFGGGPSLDQRRGFTTLRDGTHVPGYRGYCPQIKYRVGKTYGTDTHELAKSRIHVHPSNAVTPGQGVQLVELRNTLPKSTGDNKYTEQMVPGYTGYIPRMTFKFGGTYKEDCDVCIDEYMTNRSNHDQRQRDLFRQVSSIPRLTATSHDPSVKEKLDRYRDTHPSRPLLMEDKRPLTEPPIPGYNGYIPRIKPTELGLGHRYHVACDNGFSQFVRETARQSERLTGTLPKALEKIPREQLQSAPAAYNRRLYQTDGMIPKYTGYIPQKRFVFGNTYGDTTRTLEVCSHPATSFGEHIQQKEGI